MILYVDNSIYFTIAFFDNQGNILFSYQQENNQHYELLSIAIKKGLQEIGIDYHSLSKIVVNYGPGSFTGLRISIAFCQGLSFSKKIPLFTISSLRIISFLFPTPHKSLAIINPRPDVFFTGHFSNTNTFKEQNLNTKEYESFKSQFDHIIHQCNLLKNYPLDILYKHIQTITPINNTIIKPNYLKAPSVTTAKTHKILNKYSL